MAEQERKHESVEELSGEIQRLRGALRRKTAECDRLRQLAQEFDDAAWAAIQELERNGTVTSATYNTLHRAHGKWQASMPSGETDG